MSDLRIYVACLASYNSGTLHGAWIDCEGKDADELQTEVSAMLRASPEPNVQVDCPECGATHVDGCTYQGCNGTGKVPSAEEFAIHDHEGFGKMLGEFTLLADVAKHAELIAEHGVAWIAYCDYVGESYATPEGFQDAYNGTWDSEQAFAENLVEDLGYLTGVPDHVANYFDYEAFTRDLFMGDYYRDDDTGAVFNRNA
jgi:antirestriction protein